MILFLRPALRSSQFRNLFPLRSRQLRSPCRTTLSAAQPAQRDRGFFVDSGSGGASPVEMSTISFAN